MIYLKKRIKRQKVYNLLLPLYRCAQYFPEFCERKTKSTAIRTHDLCTPRADVLPIGHRASPVARGRANPMCRVKPIYILYP